MHNRFTERINKEFPVRRQVKEKESFRAWLLHELRAMGYSAELQGEHGAMNVVAGNPNTAKMFLVAHYDTGIRSILPSLILPGNPFLYALYQAIEPFCVFLLALLIAFGITFPLNRPTLTLPLFVLLLVGWLLYARYGKAEQDNRNDNGSGIAALLLTAERTTPRHRSEICFVFLDGGTVGGRGAKQFRKRYPKTRERCVLNLDCVGVGDELLFLPGKYARWDEQLLDSILHSFEAGAEKTVMLKTDGFSYFPSDNRHFRYATAICSCKERRGVGRYIAKTAGDVPDEENLRILSEGLAKLIAKYQGIKGGEK